jgi:uncharacterized membrane protein YfcA
MIRAVGCPYFRRAFGWCVPIGGLGGLIGLGGGEFRLPVLMYGIGFNARDACADLPRRHQNRWLCEILISLGVVSVGLWRYWYVDAIPMWRGAQRITTAMAAGSIIGATLGGLAVAYAPVAFLKVLLGCVLLAAAGKTAFAAHNSN